MNFLKFLFTKNNDKKEFSEEEWNNHYEKKEKAIENILGKMNELVGHAIIPFDIGGTVDMYYFSKHIKGTGFVTMELIKPDGSGPIPNKNGTYELIAFTKEKYINSKDVKKPFNIIERRICGIFTAIGNYSFQAKLEPGDTCEIPGEEGEPNIYLLFDEYTSNTNKFEINGNSHGLLLIIELFKDELDFARSNGSKSIIEKLKESHYYPYTDMNRKSVLNN